MNLRVRRQRRAGKRLESVVEFGARNQRLLAFGFQRVGEDGRGEQLHLIGRRAAIGVFERHHLALLGDAETAANRARRLRGDGVAGWRAAAD